MKILFLSAWYPYPPDNGSKIRIFNLLRCLSEYHNVTLITFFDRDEHRQEEPILRPSPSEIHVIPSQAYNPRSWRARLGYLSATPRYLADTYRPEMDSLIRQTVEKISYDLVIASQLSMARYYRCFQGVPAVFEEAELGTYWPFETQMSISRTGIRRQLTWAKHRRFMTRLLRNFRFCTVVSEVERKLLVKALPHYRSVHVIPNSIDPDRFVRSSNGRAPHSLIFAGSLCYFANHDAMVWFLREIYPFIQAELPDVQLTITGEQTQQNLPSSRNVVLSGRVHDIQSLVASSAVSLAPIRLGGGTRLKILESFALGTPVVATSKGVEGLEALDGEHLLVADTPREFAEAVLRLLREPQHAQKIADNAYKLVREHYDWKTVFPQFMDLVDQAVSTSPRDRQQIEHERIRMA
jgi:polysaccharide biosynthesis protein PslH